MADEIIDSLFDYVRSGESDRGDEEGLTNCKHCRKMCYWVIEPKPSGGGQWRLYDYHTERPHHCRRGLTPAKIVGMFDDLS